MHFFQYQGRELFAENVAITELAEKYGTPLYIYSYNTLLRHFHAYTDAFKDYPHIICFALKANSNIAILRLLAEEGGGADIVSGGELYRALKVLKRTVKLVLFPSGGHDVSRTGKPSLKVERLQHIADWFDEYLGEASS